MGKAIFIKTKTGRIAVRVPSENFEVTTWFIDGKALKVRYNSQEYVTIKNVDTGEFLGYAELVAYLAARGKEVATPESAFLSFTAPNFPPAEVGDTIKARYRGFSSDNGECFYTLEWSYEGGISVPFNVPLTYKTDGTLDIPNNVTITDTKCTVYSDTAKAFFKAHANGNASGEEISPEVVGEISKLLTDIEQDPDLSELFKLLKSLPNNSYQTQQTTWSSEVSDYDKYGNSQFEQYRDYLKNYIKNFKDNKNTILTCTEDEKLAQAARLMDKEALVVLPVASKLKLLKVLAKSSITEYWGFSGTGYDEEYLVIKIVNAVNINDLNEVNAFLDELRDRIPTGRDPNDALNLITSVRYQISLFEQLYNKVDDSVFGVGNDNLKRLVFAFYAIWENSKYNPYLGGTFNEAAMDIWNVPVATGSKEAFPYRTTRPSTINYQSVREYGMYNDSFVFAFSPWGNGIYWIEEQGIEQLYAFKEPTEAYDFFQPISLISTKQDTAVQLPGNINENSGEFEANNAIPIFFLTYVDQKGDAEDFTTKVGLLFDVITIFTGVGAIAKLRHLRHVSKLGQFAIALAGGIEVSSGALSFYLTYAKSDCNTDFCKNLKQTLFWLEIASLSADFLATQMVRRSARKTVKDGKPDDFVGDGADDAYGKLDELADIDGLYNNFRTRLAESYPNSTFLNKIDNLDEDDKLVFMFDFYDDVADQLKGELLDAIVGPPELLESWSAISKYNVGLRKNVDFLKEIEKIEDQSLLQLLDEDFTDPDFGADLIDFFNNNPKSFSGWAALKNHSELRKNTQFLDNVSTFANDPDALLLLDADLSNEKWAEELKEFFTESPSDVVNFWKKMKNEPGLSWRLASESPNTRWDKWGRREFFKGITGYGKFFEEVTVLKQLRNKNSEAFTNLRTKINSDFPSIDLTEYDLFSQVQLFYTKEKYFVADQVFVKYNKGRGGEEIIGDIIIIENKLKQTTKLTDNQDAASKISSYWVRNTKEIESKFGTKRILDNTEKLSFDRNQIKWYKMYDTDKGEVIEGIEKIN